MARLPGMASEHPSVIDFRDELTRRGGTGDVVILPDAVHTAALAAAALGCEVGAIANSLLFDAGGEPVLILTSGAHRVDVDKVADLAGLARIEQADPAFVREHTGFAIGGVAPVGHPHPLRTVIDVTLGRYTTVWAAAGHSHSVFATTYDELIRMTGGQPMDVA